MLRTDQESLVCDLAETYGVFDYKALPVEILAVLVAGLREESRSKMNLSGRKAAKMEILVAAAVDRLSRIAWLLGFVCPHEGEPPRSVLSAILGEAEIQEGDAATVFDSPEAFEQEWERITGVSHGKQ